MNRLDRTDLKACHARLCNGSRSFYAASFLLPREVRDPAAALYAFCRVADDAVDQPGGGSRHLAEFRIRLAGIYAGRPAPAAEDRAFASVVEHFRIPRALPEALLEGFEWDLDNRRYDDLDDLHAYSARVAGTVGSMMAIIMGVRDTELIARACELGMAMQLTNIARDVGEDARSGRLYLPRQWMLEAGLDPESWLASPCFNDALAVVISRLLREADTLYARAEAGIAALPATCRMGIRSASLIYSEIGREVENGKLDSVSRRAVVPAARKLALILRAASGNESLMVADGPAPPAAQFLINAVAQSPRFQGSSKGTTLFLPPAWWEIRKRVQWTVELFERLGQREQLRRSHELSMYER
ncbi:MAG: phytoene/squalene synthase family protein [Gammaproteobacteria bacterium]|nr:phytoene/squalene synthase family protein [Gammaproteobacteria bacterium]MCY4357342.1 phytoene/squalene synthase family protein [Gammaproteobacteria bacterium]